MTESYDLYINRNGKYRVRVKNASMAGLSKEEKRLELDAFRVASDRADELNKLNLTKSTRVTL